MEQKTQAVSRITLIGGKTASEQRAVPQNQWEYSMVLDQLVWKS